MTKQREERPSEPPKPEGSPSVKAKPLLLGHRGARPVSRLNGGEREAGVPAENTLAAFEYAIGQRCDGFEFDVRVTRDERLVVCHDDSLAGRKVATSLYDSLVSRRGETLPCLEDVLAGFGHRGYLDIEIKIGGGEELVLNALRRHKPERYLISSFLPEVLRRFHQLEPSLPLGYIWDRAEDVSIWCELPVRVILPQCDLVSQKLLQEVHERELQVFTWTVNRQEDMRRLADWGVDGLISDDPGMLARVLGA